MCHIQIYIYILCFCVQAITVTSCILIWQWKNAWNSPVFLASLWYSLRTLALLSLESSVMLLLIHQNWDFQQVPKVCQIHPFYLCQWLTTWVGGFALEGCAYSRTATLRLWCGCGLPCSLPKWTVRYGCCGEMMTSPMTPHMLVKKFICCKDFLDPWNLTMGFFCQLYLHHLPRESLFIDNFDESTPMEMDDHLRNLLLQSMNSPIIENVLDPTPWKKSRCHRQFHGVGNTMPQELHLDFYRIGTSNSWWTGHTYVLNSCTLMIQTVRHTQLSWGGSHSSQFQGGWWNQWQISAEMVEIM